ncbi:hypothetical protein ASPZODRAFT_71566 [Penicilliopsis zonata CBS 506.65]|uniref:Rho-like small GTPase n=1 Tax=Penicilliopsis zonata CBS 506.65 TaxID=1073090 RepID=A0A1L9SAY1_9EURO|nr:hypothetical protein ASPZODRAFT_71566 [Penicilliopsis zonata CBS 506.65]OJJ44340.1 hypothetical protein ASPZODRAFT_71566 [Penicilliopsis zonata CBS 506.65]
MSEETYPNSDATATILLLGDSGCGKTTFLNLKKDNRGQGQGTGAGEVFRDTDQPFLYNVRFTKKNLQIEFYDSSNPNQHWSMLQPNAIILAFDISNRDTLDGLKAWRNDITRFFQHGYGEKIPIMLLGLKRDLRVEGEGIIYPQESYRIAQELRCDRYAECSAVTGELMAEAFEDIARLAGMAIFESELGRQDKGGCCIL